MVACSCTCPYWLFAFLEEKSSAPNKEQDSRMERAESTLKKIMDATGVTTTEVWE